jgi:hypothetical protein
MLSLAGLLALIAQIFGAMFHVCDLENRELPQGAIPPRRRNAR